jgi:hypothetical protein
MLIRATRGLVAEIGRQEYRPHRFKSQQSNGCSTAYLIDYAVYGSDAEIELFFEIIPRGKL